MNATVFSSDPRPQPSMALLPRISALRPESTRLEGLDAWVYGWQGRFKRWSIGRSRLRRQGESARRLCEALSGLNDTELHIQLKTVRETLRRDPRNACGRLVHGLAVVGQFAHRQLGMMPYPVQFMGALAIHRGCLAEMATGEGKTLTVGMAGALAAMSGRPCHIITANDYLAQRDAQEMEALYRACGLSLATVQGSLAPEERPSRYRNDVVYLTAKELLADFLRDEIGPGSVRERSQAAFYRWLGSPPTASAGAAQPSTLLVRGVHTAIVDEADSLLIDEAVTPLILAAPRESRGLADAVQRISLVADALTEGLDYVLVLQTRSVSLLPRAMEQLTMATPDIPPVWRPAPRREELLRQALLVRHFFKPGQHYVVQDNEVVLLDAFTGRMTPGRSLTAGLHQAIEAFEGLPITDPNESLTQMSFQAFFSRLPQLAGCTGTAREAADELWRVYALPVVRVPTHKPRQTRYRIPVVARCSQDKWKAVADEVRTEQAAGRPVLVGVRSVGASETLARCLADLPDVQVLNALKHDQEAAIVAQAGQAGRVTLATHMAGRGTDIRLGEGVADRGGLHVIVAEANESVRVDRQLAGRCGRQGDPGSVSTYYALDDELAERMLPPWWRALLGALLKSAPLLAAHLTHLTMRWAQRRSETHAFAKRWSVLKSDEWMRSALPFLDQGGRS
jgi:preprotein translocase subunit SecA